MALTEEEYVTWSVTKDRSIQVLTVTVILRDGVEIGRTNHRHVLTPGESLDGEHPDVIEAAQVLWKPEVVTAHAAQQALDKSK